MESKYLFSMVEKGNWGINIKSSAKDLAACFPAPRTSHMI